MKAKLTKISHSSLKRYQWPLASVLIALLVAALMAGGPAYAESPAAAAAAQAGELSDAEIAGLLFMREEEKLAHDVYVTLYETWGIAIFRNIANSEAKHTDAVKGLIDRYGLVDPVQDTTIGVFADEMLQALYDELVVEGSQSLESALRVGAAIEEIDILDLQERIAATDRADIQRVYGSLLKGSYNHLRAFVSNLSRQTGETYQPQYLDPAAYEEIVGSNTERGNGGNQGNSGNQGNGGGRGNGGEQGRGGKRGGN